MDIAAIVVEEEPVPFALLQPQLCDIWKRLTVDRPMVEVFLVTGNFADQHFEPKIGFGRRMIVREHGVVPWAAPRIRRLLPLRVAGHASILHHHAHAHFAFFFVYRAENPHAWILHFDNRIDALANVQIKHIHSLWPGNWIAVQRDDPKLMPGKRKSNLIRCARVHEAEQNSLTLPHPNRLTGPEHLAIERSGSVHDLPTVIGGAPWFRATAPSGAARCKFPDRSRRGDCPVR